MKTDKRKEITKILSLSIQKHINPRNDSRIYWSREVTFDYRTKNAKRVDYMRFKPVNNTVGGIEKGDIYCYEVKSSVADFHSKNGHRSGTHRDCYGNSGMESVSLKGNWFSEGILISFQYRVLSRITYYTNNSLYSDMTASTNIN